MKELNKKELKGIFCQFKEGNMGKYNEFYEKYYTVVYGIVFSFIKNKENTEDIVQEIFVKIYKMDKESFPIKGELSWLYIVSKNEALQFLRKNKKEINIEEIYEIKKESNELEDIIDMNTYNKMICGLNDIEKQIISLKIISNFTFRKIGQMLSMPTATVQWRYYKAVDSLKISMGSLVGFIFTFIILMERTVNKKIRFNDKNYKEELIEQKESNSDKEDSKRINEDLSESSKTSESNNYISINGIEKSDIKEEAVNENIVDTYQTVDNTAENIGYVDVIMIGFSSVFLIISIIFAIFFKIYQQQRKIKASK